MKKLTCILICLSASAHASLSPNDTFTGYYLTAGVGATGVKFDTDVNLVSVNGIPFDFDVIQDNQIHARSAAGLLGLSYLYQFTNKFVLGLQATAGYIDAERGNKTVLNEALYFPGATIEIQVDHQVSAKLTNDFSVSLKPGIVAHTHTLFYAMVGPRWGNFETSSSTDFLFGQIPGGSITSEGSAKESGYQLGVTAGLGIQQMLTDHFHLNLEYAYTSYGNITIPGMSATFEEDGATLVGSEVIDGNKIDVATSTVMLAVSYQW